MVRRLPQRRKAGRLFAQHFAQQPHVLGQKFGRLPEFGGRGILARTSSP